MIAATFPADSSKIGIETASPKSRVHFTPTVTGRRFATAAIEPPSGVEPQECDSRGAQLVMPPSEPSGDASSPDESTGASRATELPPPQLQEATAAQANASRPKADMV